MNVDETSTRYKLRAALMVERSDTRFESRARRNISAGFRARTTTTERIAMIAMTTNNSINVNPFVVLFSLVFIEILIGEGGGIDGYVQIIAIVTAEVEIVYGIGNVASVGREAAYLVAPTSEVRKCRGIIRVTAINGYVRYIIVRRIGNIHHVLIGIETVFDVILATVPNKRCLIRIGDYRRAVVGIRRRRRVPVRGTA